jgi:hypothetical protein
MMTRLPFDSSPQVSSGLALLFIIILSSVVGWMAVSAGTNIVQGVKDSPLTDTGRYSGLMDTKR